MAAPTNTFITNNAVGNRESLHDIITILDVVRLFLTLTSVLWCLLYLKKQGTAAISCLLLKWAEFTHVCRRLLTRCLPGQGKPREPIRRAAVTKLTKRFVDRLKTGAADVVHWDDELSGFGVRVKPT